MKGLLCMRLNTAGLLIGWVGIVLSIVSIIIFILCFSHLDELANIIANRMDSAQPNLEKVRRLLSFFASIYLGINVINLLASALLIMGIKGERHVLLVPWLFNSGIAIFFNFIYFIYFAMITMTPNSSITIPVLIAGLSLALHICTWLLVYIIYRNIESGREKQQLLRANTETNVHSNKPPPKPPRANAQQLLYPPIQTNGYSRIPPPKPPRFNRP